MTSESQRLKIIRIGTLNLDLRIVQKSVKFFDAHSSLFTFFELGIWIMSGHFKSCSTWSDICEKKEKEKEKGERKAFLIYDLKNFFILGF